MTVIRHLTVGVVVAALALAAVVSCSGDLAPDTRTVLAGALDGGANLSDFLVG